MYLLYSLLLTLAFLALLPYFAWQAVVHRKYLNNLAERLGRLPAAWRMDARPTLWLHAVSVGEKLAALPLLKALHTQFPNHRLIVSTTTATGQQVARERALEAAGVCYFPFDWRFAVRRALAVIRPQAVILMESELWPNFLAECHAQRIPVLVANGRISDRSFRRSQRVRWLLKPLYRQVSRFLMQSAADAERALALGAEPGSVAVSGNLKYDIGAFTQTPQLTALAEQLNAAFQLDRAPLIVAGSSCEGEEGIILEAFGALRQTPEFAEVRLLLAPRHPERFDLVAQAHEYPGGMVRRSSYEPPATRSYKFASSHEEELYALMCRTTATILLDSLGELAALYQFAQIVFVGGSLVARGGHNILEPALYGKPIIVGPHMENFRAIAQEFLEREALLQLHGGDRQALVTQLSAAFERLLRDQAYAQRLGVNARQTIEANRGATARTVTAVASLLA